MSIFFVRTGTCVDCVDRPASIKTHTYQHPHMRKKRQPGCIHHYGRNYSHVYRLLAEVQLLLILTSSINLSSQGEYIQWHFNRNKIYIPIQTNSSYYINKDNFATSTSMPSKININPVSLIRSPLDNHSPSQCLTPPDSTALGLVE